MGMTRLSLGLSPSVSLWVYGRTAKTRQLNPGSRTCKTTLTLCASTVSRVRDPRLLLHRLPDVPVADKLHAASDDDTAGDHQLRVRVPDFVDRSPRRRPQGSPAASARLDMYSHRPDGLLPLHAAQDPRAQGGLRQHERLLHRQLYQHGRPAARREHRPLLSQGARAPHLLHEDGRRDNGADRRQDPRCQ